MGLDPYFLLPSNPAANCSHVPRATVGSVEGSQLLLVLIHLLGRGGEWEPAKLFSKLCG